MNCIINYWGNGSEWFWAFLQLVAVIISFLFIYYQLKIQTASHIVQALTITNNSWNSKEMLIARNKVCEDWLNEKYNFDGVAEFIAEYMEELGNYIQIGAIHKRQIWEAHSWYIEHYYCMFKQGILNCRNEYKDNTLYSEFEKLYVAMNEISKKEQVPTFERTDSELKKFCEGEVKLTKAFIGLKSSKSN